MEKLLTDSSATVQKYAKRALERLKTFKPVPEKVTPEEKRYRRNREPLPAPTVAEVIRSIKRTGGKVKVDEVEEIVIMDLSHTLTNDAALFFYAAAGLKKLEELGLYSTKVTDAGVRQLQQALPNCKIRR